jgi:hypothetical protein
MLTLSDEPLDEVLPLLSLRGHRELRRDHALSVARQKFSYDLRRNIVPISITTESPFVVSARPQEEFEAKEFVLAQRLRE